MQSLLHSFCGCFRSCCKLPSAGHLPQQHILRRSAHCIARRTVGSLMNCAYVVGIASQIRTALKDTAVDGRAQHVLKKRTQAREKRLASFKQAVIAWTDRVSGVGFLLLSGQSGFQRQAWDSAIPYQVLTAFHFFRSAWTDGRAISESNLPFPHLRTGSWQRSGETENATPQCISNVTESKHVIRG